MKSKMTIYQLFYTFTNCQTYKILFLPHLHQQFLKSHFCLNILHIQYFFCPISLPSVASDFCMRTALLGWIYRQAGSHEFRSVFCYLPQAAKQSEI